MKTELNFHIFCYVLLLLCSDASTVGDSLVSSELNGKELIKMGNVLNKPLLTLLGETFVKMKYNLEKQFSEKIEEVEKNLQDVMKNLTEETAIERKSLKTELCKLRICTEWTEWSTCSASVIRTFGASTRSRTCGGSSNLCPSNSAKKVETDSRICQGAKCKSSKYTLTKNQFCIRLSNTVKKSWKSAPEECHKDGGHLINIDSELKTQDVNETLQTISFTSIWIDGRRTLPNGEWVYEYEAEDTGFSNWHGSEPSSNDDCRAYVTSSNIWYWWGKHCITKYYFLCEMV